jgi:hypothetical protein
MPDSQSQRQKNHRLQLLLFPSAEMTFSPLRFSATVANSFPKSSPKD